MKKNLCFCAMFIAFIFVSCKKDKPGSASANGLSDITSGQHVHSIDSPLIVIIGASTAAGTGATPIDSSWVNRLRLTTAQNPKPLTYINLALGGYTTYQGMPTGFKPPVSGRPLPDTARNITKAISLHPNLVMITFPSNDVANGFADDEVINNYAKMVSLLDSAKVPFILFGTQPRNFGASDSAKRLRLKTLNDKIKAIYTSRTNDYYNLLSTADFMIKPALSFGDGIHVNNKGHYIIMQTVLNHPIFQGVIQ